ncbi:hypothetical protein G0Z08_13535, partial [Staphylococcus aureus]|nr:hypothetical protein [Staphylococcus aureus]
SLAVKYNPESYNILMRDDKVFEKYQLSSIKQLMMTNEKFEFLSNSSKLKFLNLVNFKVKELTDEEIEELYDFENADNRKRIEILINEYEINISEYIFRTSEQKRMIKVQKNGVIGVDQNIIDNDIDSIKKVMDLLNYGNGIKI